MNPLIIVYLPFYFKELLIEYELYMSKAFVQIIRHEDQSHFHQSEYVCNLVVLEQKSKLSPIGELCVINIIEHNDVTTSFCKIKIQRKLLSTQKDAT